MTAPIPADQTIQELAVVHGSTDTARLCAADCLRDLACELQDAGRSTMAILIFATRSSLGELWCIQGALTTVSTLTGDTAQRARRALENLIAAHHGETWSDPYVD